MLLLTPEGEFHSFGFTARDFYHDLQSREARRWLYFDRFKMLLHHNKVGEVVESVLCVFLFHGIGFIQSNPIQYEIDSTIVNYGVFCNQVKY